MSDPRDPDHPAPDPVDDALAALIRLPPNYGRRVGGTPLSADHEQRMADLQTEVLGIIDSMVDGSTLALQMQCALRLQCALWCPGLLFSWEDQPHAT